MRSRLVPILAVGLLVAGLAPGAHRDAMATREVAPDPTPPPPTVSQLFPKTEADGMLWPLNRAYVWQINRYDAAVEGDTLTLEIRTTHEPWQGGSNPVPNYIPKNESEKTIHLGGPKVVGGLGPKQSIMVSVQIIDLDKVAIPAGKDSFRLLASLKVGAGTTYLSREKSILKGTLEGSGGGSAHRGWKNGELHLFDLFFREKDKLASYCFVLVQAKDWTK